MSEFKDTKGLHGAYIIAMAVAMVITGGGTYLVKPTTVVMDRTETERVVSNQLLVLKNENLQLGQEDLVKQIKQDIQITHIEILATQNEGRIEELEDEYLEQRVINQKILTKVEKL